MVRQGKAGSNFGLYHYLYIISDQKNPKEASNIFHSIIKASVSPKKVICPECGWIGKPIAGQPGKYKCGKGHKFSE